MSDSEKVVVVGGGAAGLGAVIFSARAGAEVVLLETQGCVGGELLSGMPILGAYDAMGRPCTGGVIDELLDICRELNGYIGPVCDWRTVCGVCVDPCMLPLAISRLLGKYGVEVLLNTTVRALDSVDGRVTKVVAVTRTQQIEIDCSCLIDATGGGNIVRLAGGDVLEGSSDGAFQPVSLIFRMAGVDFKRLMDFVGEHFDEILLAENDALGVNSEQAARKLCEAGHPYLALSAHGQTMGSAISRGEMFETTAVYITPTSISKREVCLNVTRVANIDPRDPATVSGAVVELGEQIEMSRSFLKKSVPGFADAEISHVAYRVGVRETGRIVGEQTLSQDEVVDGRDQPNSIARGAHHVDIHGSGKDQIRIPVKGGGSYGIPFGCLVPVNVQNVLVAGRCLSSDRGANGSARVMGTCLATGQAAGVAAAIMKDDQLENTRDISIRLLQHRLTQVGAII